MTEEEVIKMEVEVFATPSDAVLEREFFHGQLALVVVEEQKLMAAWKLARLMRDDARMKQVADNLEKTRVVKKICQDKLTELSNTM